MDNLFFDSESVGFHGQAVLFQYAVNDGPVVLYEPWKEPIGKTLELIDWFLTHNIIGFNLAFDMFLLAKMYTLFRLYPKHLIPEEHVDELAIGEPAACNGPCIKSASCLDLMLHSRKGQFQSLMQRDPVRIKRVPAVLANVLAAELERLTEIDGIYFAKTKDRTAPKWRILDIKSARGIVNPDFKDVVLKFNPAGGLKYLAEYILKKPSRAHFADIELDREYRPIELGYAPFALANASPPNWEIFNSEHKVIGYAWPRHIPIHIEHWHSNQAARDYAKADVEDTRDLYKYFGCPEHGDDDSVLAAMVASVRWHGFNIDIEGLEDLAQQAIARIANAPVNVNKHKAVRRYLEETLDDTETLILDLKGTRKACLEELASKRIEETETCTKCLGAGCPRCQDGELPVGPHPVAIRATEVLEIRKAKKELEVFSKLLQAKRFYANFKVIGSLSMRMSGDSGLNAMGINHAKEIRKNFIFRWDDMKLCGGDFDSFEVTITDAVCNDTKLRQLLLEGKSIHALLGMDLYEKSYDEIKASKGHKTFDMYTRAKQGFFGGIVYGGDYNTWHNKLAIPLEHAKKVYDKWNREFPGIAAMIKGIKDSFCSMQQPDGLGTRVVWHEPKDYVETFLGDRRYFTLENKVCKILFNLANKPPKSWSQCRLKVVRRDREQFVGGAVKTALYSAAFQLQAANMRAANNDLIQSPGAVITKYLQRKIWDHQPVGVHDWVVMPLQVHDEVMSVTRPDYVDRVAQTVHDAVEHFRPQVPLIGMEWNKNMKNWSEK